MSSEPESSKERKKSAHWSETDTVILINTLMQHKDSGRTVDNGFKPAVWRIASEALHGVEHVGGPKTPDACKSRWQRLQRDYKAAKEMEQYPGFSWDKGAGRLTAPPEAWEAADKLSLDAYKHQKIHLPMYDLIAVLCPLDGAARKGRGKARSSMASSSTSEMSHKQPESLAAAFEAVGNGHHHHNDTQHWAGLEAEMDYEDHSYQLDEQYGLGRPQKRHSQLMDPNLMASAASSPSAPKRARPSPIITQQPQVIAPKFNGLQQLPQGLRTPNGTQFIHQPQPQHHHLAQLAPQLSENTGHHQPPQPPMMQLAPRSPDFPNPPLLETTSIHPSIMPQVQAAGLAEPQRRSAAILMLQERETDLNDDELLDVVTEFELNITSADTYLALSKQAVRKLWLQRIIQRATANGHNQNGTLTGNGAFSMEQNQEWGTRG